MSEKANKQETLEKINSCEQRVLALEKNKSTHLYSKRHEYRSLYCTLEELELKFFAERRIKKHELRQEISRIRSNVNGFHRMLSGMKPDPAFVEKLKQTMEAIETSIMNFKEKQREDYESMLLEEQTANQEINAFDRKLDSWLSIPRAAHLKPTETAAMVTAGPPKLAPSSMPPAVMAFERFLQQTGGREGGWDDYDHKIFLKTRSLYNAGNPAFLEAAEKELPTKTAKEIREHEQWYAEFATLLNSKKRAIEAWKDEKQSQRKKHSEEVGEVDDTKPSSKHEIIEKEREARFAKLETWKAEQKLRQVEAEEEKLKKQLLESKKQERANKRRLLEKLRLSGKHLVIPFHSIISIFHSTIP